VRRLVLAMLMSGCAAYGSAVLITSPNQLLTTDVMNWSQLGGDQAAVASNFFAYTSSLTGSTFVDTVSVRMNGAAGGRQLQAGTDWAAGQGFDNNDALLQTSSTGTNGDGPITFGLNGSYGVGAYVDTGDAVGQFTARIQAFSGINTVLLDTKITSDNTGDPLFVGALDTKSDISRLVVSLFVNGVQDNNIVIDKLLFQNQAGSPLPVTLTPLAPITQPAPVSAVPEPGAISLMLLGCLGLVYKGRNRFRKGC
jgi:hypothetical protein